jgi:hypothetical protein
MMRKTFMAMAAVAALGVSSTAMAAMHGGPGRTSVHGGGGMSTMHAGPMHAGPMHAGPMHAGPGRLGAVGPGPRFKTAHVHSGPFIRHHRHHRNAFFVGAGFAGPWYDYGYSSCWSLVPTAWGWRRVWVCDYPYGGWW